MKTNKYVYANALALAGGIYYALCYIFFIIAPKFFMQITNSWFHMIQVDKITRTSYVTSSEFLFGLITFTLNAWIFGLILGWGIERFGNKKS